MSDLAAAVVMWLAVMVAAYLAQRGSYKRIERKLQQRTRRKWTQKEIDTFNWLKSLNDREKK